MLDDSRPLFEQIAEQIELGIIDGTYKEQTAVPSTNELARYLRVNPATANRGLGLLVDREIVVKRRGVGMFVREGARARLVDERTREFAAQFVAPMVRQALKLDIRPERLAEMIEDEVIAVRSGVAAVEGVST